MAELACIEAFTEHQRHNVRAGFVEPRAANAGVVVTLESRKKRVIQVAPAKHRLIKLISSKV